MTTHALQHGLDRGTANKGTRAVRVVHFHRWPSPRSFSVERLFKAIRDELPPEIQCRVAVSKWPSTGAFKRFYNVIEAWFKQGDVNHITGDVHFLTYLLHKRRTVLTVHDCVSMRRLSGIRQHIFRLLWLMIPARRCAVLVAVSEFSKRELLLYANCSPEKIRVIGVPVGSEFSPVPARFSSVRPRLLHIGTGPNKNLEYVVRALEGIPCRLMIVGPLSPAQLEILCKCGIDYENRTRLGDDEMVAAYNNCDIVVFASTYEGFGMPIIEANIVGRPVVTSNVCSMPEVAGDAACLVDPHDIASIRMGILRVMRDEDYRNYLVQNGFRNATRFTRASIARQYADLYLELVSADQVKSTSNLLKHTADWLRKTL